MTLEQKVNNLRKTMNGGESKDKVKEVYDEYVETYKTIKVPKVMHMLEFRDLFFKYHDYMNRRNI